MLSLAYRHEAEDKCHEKQYHPDGSPKALLLADGTEDKIGILFGHIFQFGLCAVEEAFTPEAARTDGDFRLVHVVAGTPQILLHTQSHLDTLLLVGFQHLVEGIVDRKEEDYRDQRGGQNGENAQ